MRKLALLIAAGIACLFIFAPFVLAADFGRHSPTAYNCNPSSSRANPLNCEAFTDSQTFDPTDASVFQTVFGMIFTVIIALEFKRSLLVLAERRESGVGLLDENSDPSERLAPPITQLIDSRTYQLRGRVSSFSFLRAALPLLHGCCRSPVT